MRQQAKGKIHFTTMWPSLKLYLLKIWKRASGLKFRRRPNRVLLFCSGYYLDDCMMDHLCDLTRIQDRRPKHTHTQLTTCWGWNCKCFASNGGGISFLFDNRRNTFKVHIDIDV